MTTSDRSSSGSATGGAIDVRDVNEHIVEFVSDSGEGAQTAGQMFGTVSAKMGNGVWTVEIIPAEIEPPTRTRSSASGNRIRIATTPVTNIGETADVVVAFNEQVLYSRIDIGAFREGTIIFLESRWAEHEDEVVRAAYREARDDLVARGFDVRDTPMDAECRKIVEDPRRGKNLWALGMICAVYERDLDLVRAEISRKFKRKGQEVIDANVALFEAGHAWALENVPLRFRVAPKPPTQPMVVMNGNQALALGIMAAGMDVCSMYPITPATSASHYLAAAFKGVGGVVHQAEDEISAIGFALGASYSGRTSVTITSGPGLALKTEFIGLATAAEIPLVIIVVQRGSPSTGLPTRVEQGDLLAALYGSPGDSPKIVLAPSTIEECFHFVVTARRLAEAFRSPVVVLSDANLATSQQPFPRPAVQEDWLAPEIDQSPWDKEVRPYEWDPETGISQRPIPGQRDGCYVLTGLAHDESSRIAYESAVNQRAMTARSNKLRTLKLSLKPPGIYGDDEGDLLVVGWGSTRGAIEEAVDRLRAEGHKVSSITLRFLSPLEPDLETIFRRFKRVMTIEMNYSDDFVRGGCVRRHSQLALLLRADTLIDVDCWSRVPGVPFPPGMIEKVLRERLNDIAEGA